MASKTKHRQNLDAYKRFKNQKKRDSKFVPLETELARFENEVLNKPLNIQIGQIPLSTEYLEYDRQINTMLDLTPEQVLEQFQQLGTTRNLDEVKTYHTLNHLLFATHSRASDLQTLKVSDIDFENMELLMNTPKKDVGKVGILFDHNDNELVRMLKEQIQGKGPDDLVFSAVRGDNVPIATDDINKYIQDMARTTKGVDVSNFSMAETGTSVELDGIKYEWGDDYKTAISKTYRKHGGTMLALSDDYFRQLNISPAEYARDDLGHISGRMPEWYQKAATRIQLDYNRNDPNVIITEPHPRTRAMIERHLGHAQRGKDLESWNDKHIRLRTGIKEEAKFGAPKIEKVKKQVKKEIAEELSEYQQLKNRLEGEGPRTVSPARVESLIMPEGLSLEEQQQFLKDRASGKTNLQSPITDPDPRLKVAADPEKVHAAKFLKDTKARNVASARLTNMDLNLIDNFFNEGSQMRAKYNIKLNDAVPQILNKFLDDYDFVNMSSYFDKMGANVSEIVKSAMDTPIPANDILLLGDNVTSWNNIGDLGEFFGEAARVGTDADTLAIKIPEKVAREFSEIIEYRSRVHQIAQNLIEAADHTLIPDKLQSGIGRLDHIVDRLEIGLGNYVQQSTNDVPVSSYINTQKTPSRQQFVADLTEALQDARGKTQAEYTSLKTHYFDELIDNNPDFFGPLADDTKKAYTTTKKFAENSLIRTIQLEPLFQAFKDTDLFNDLAYDKEGSKNMMIEYDKPLSERLAGKDGTFKLDGRPAVRKKDYGTVTRSNLARIIFNEALPELTPVTISGKAYSVGYIPFVDIDGNEIDDISMPNARDMTGEVVETLEDAKARRALNTRTVLNWGVVPLTGIQFLMSNTAFGKAAAFGTNVLAEVGIELALANYDTLVLDAFGNPLFEKVSGIAPEYSTGKTTRNLRNLALNNPDQATQFLETDLAAEGFDEPLTSQGYFSRAITNAGAKVKDFFREMTDLSTQAGAVQAAQETGQYDMFLGEEFEKRLKERREEEREIARPLAGRSLTETQAGFEQGIQDEITGFESGYGYGSLEKMKSANPRGYRTGKQRYDKNIKIQENLNKAKEQGIDSQMNEILSTNQEGENDAVNARLQTG